MNGSSSFRLLPAVATTPLGHRDWIAGDGISMREVPDLEKCVLRQREAARGNLLLPPIGYLLATPFEGRAIDIHAIGPDEWFVTAHDLPGKQGGWSLLTDLARAGPVDFESLVDVGDYYTTIEMVGIRCRSMLMKLSTIDFDRRAFAGGMAVATLLGAANPVIAMHSDEDDEAGVVLRLHVRRSHADYLWCLLAEAGREFGLPAQTVVSGEKIRS